MQPVHIFISLFYFIVYSVGGLKATIFCWACSALGIYFFAEYQREKAKAEAETVHQFYR